MSWSEVSRKKRNRQRKKSARKSPLKQPRKSSNKRTGRKSPRKSNPIRHELKKFAPLRTTNVQPARMEKWLRVANEGKFEVERRFEGGPGSIYAPYYKSNPHRHHVWTDHLVVRRGTQLDNTNRDANNCITLKELKKYNLSCLDDPENHFYLQPLGEKMGYGLFARHAIPANTVIGEYTGELITEEECDERSIQMKKKGLLNYNFCTYSTMKIDAGAMGNHTRFINHDCGDKLNCRTLYVEVGICPRNFVVSKQAIKTDEQLFIWYGKGYFTNMDCLCNSKKIKCITKNR